MSDPWAGQAQPQPPATAVPDLRGGSRPVPMGPEEQRQIHHRITDLLVAWAPPDHLQIRVVYRAAGRHEEVVGHIMGRDGQLREWEPPGDLNGLFQRLRAGAYRDGIGTWAAASTVVENPPRTSINYLFDEDPRWHQPPSRYAVLDELEMFPRSPDHVAAWMIAVLPNAARVAEVAGRFRHARIFDHRDAGGRPVVDRPPVPEAEVADVLAYLNQAPVILAGRGFDPDLFAPGGPADVPAGYHTDGTWIWTASVPHYLAKHRVPPEADLVAHIRARGFAVPPLDQEARDAAYIALTGEIPAPPPTPAAAQPAPAAQPVQPPPATAAPAAPAPAPAAAAPVAHDGGAAAEISDRDRRTLAIVEQRVGEAGAIPQAYRILDSAEGAVCLERVDGGWRVADYERGQPRNPHQFARVWDAGAYLLGRLTVIPTSLRAGGGDRNTAKALNDWPIQPLPMEPPLTLLAGKHIAVLMPGRALVRYGPAAGNLTFAAGTELSAMSLKAERAQQGPRHYRVVRELRTLAGTTVPWHEQPGGGAAYLLPRSVEQHLADGSLTELT
jgi:nicrotizing toxin Mtb-like protein